MVNNLIESYPWAIHSGGGLSRPVLWAGGRADLWDSFILWDTVTKKQLPRKR